MANFKTILFAITIIYSYSVYSQSEIKCEDILKMELNLETNPENLQRLIDSFSLFKNCGFDETDIEVFSSSAMIGSVLIDLVSEKDTDSILTYKNLYDKISAIVESDEYKKNKPLLKVSFDLAKRPADIKHWEQDKLLFQQLNVPDDYINEFHDYLKEYSDPNKTYQDLFANFKEEQKTEKDVELNDLKGIFKNAGNVNYEDLLKESIKLNKPLLLYFTGYACVNCRKMEYSTFSNETILERLKNDFHFINLYVDDQSRLPEDEWIKLEHNGKTITKIGQKHSNLQRTKFRSNSQPHFVLIDKNGIIIAETGYTNDEEIFKKFLNSAK